VKYRASPADKTIHAKISTQNEKKKKPLINPCFGILRQITKRRDTVVRAEMVTAGISE